MLQVGNPDHGCNSGHRTGGVGKEVDGPVQPETLNRGNQRKTKSGTAQSVQMGDGATRVERGYLGIKRLDDVLF